MCKPGIFFCLAVLLAALPAQAAIKFAPKSAMLTVEQVSNPKPAPGDILLPMPGGLSMAFRAVCIPAKGYLDAIEEQHGIAAAPAGDAGGAANLLGGYVAHQHTVSLSAPYTLNELPKAWGEDVIRHIMADPACSASPDSGLRAQVYLIGKYEVSRAQWRAVTEHDEAAPLTLQPDDYLPQGGISWFDAMVFAHRFSEWLMANKPEYLPVFERENRSAFIRLPSEQEWEFAARGGHKASPAERANTALFPMPSASDPKEYIAALAYAPTLSNLAPVGSLNPNPLGLHDILGNADEIVSSPFQLIAGGRLVGGHGGFIIKGGSWRAAAPEELHPGRRIEAAHYLNGKALARDDMGLRVSLGSILTPRERHEELEREWNVMSTPIAAGARPEVDDVRIVIREVVREVENPALRKRLEHAEGIASLYHQKVNENEDRMIRETLMGALFSLETTANYGVRCYQMILMKRMHDEDARKAQDFSQKNAAALDKEIATFMDGIKSALFYYKGMLREASRFDAGRILPQLEKVSLQFANDNGFSRAMTRRVGVLRKHLARNGPSPLSDMEVLTDVFPEDFRAQFKPYW